LLVACLGLVSVIAVRSYQAARWLAEAGPPSPLLKRPEDAKVENLQRVSFVSHGLHLAGWYVPSKNRAAVVVTHGSGSDRGGMLSEIRVLAAGGFGVLAFDWAGLGESEGPIHWGAQARDSLSSAIDWLAARPDVDSGRIGGLGFSIGGFVLAQVAAKDHRLRAVVIESAASDFDAYVKVHYGKWGILSEWPARWALRDSGLFSPEDTALARIGGISPRPVFILGETGDPNVPESMLRKLDDAARPPKEFWLISGSQHGSYEQAAGGEYARRLLAFFDDKLMGAVADPP
jgi:pimeloyl-ACP methyl ester carboxylesterase